MLLVISLTLLFVSALLEEVIWRGNFYVYLRKNYTLSQTAIITAVIWSVWHLPIALFYKEYENVLLGIIGYMGILFLLSIMLTYSSVYGKSVIPAAILHGGFNGFYFSSGINISWKLEFIEIAEFLVLAICFAIFVWIYRAYKRK